MLAVNGVETPIFTGILHVTLIDIQSKGRSKANYSGHIIPESILPAAEQNECGLVSR